MKHLKEVKNLLPKVCVVFFAFGLTGINSLALANEERCQSTMNQFLRQVTPPAQFNSPGNLNKSESMPLNSQTVLASITTAASADQRASLATDLDRLDELEERDAALQGLNPRSGFIDMFEEAQALGENLQFNSQIVFQAPSGSKAYPGEPNYLNNEPVLVALRQGSHTSAFIFRQPNGNLAIAHFTPDCYVRRISFYDYSEGDIAEPFIQTSLVTSVSDSLCNDLRQNLDVVTQYIANSYGANTRLKSAHRQSIRRIITGTQTFFPQMINQDNVTEDAIDLTPNYVDGMQQACENYRPHMNPNPASISTPVNAPPRPIGIGNQ